MSTADFFPAQDLSSPIQNATTAPPLASPRRNVRHAKGLSLNFPILLPSHQSSQASSPRAASPVNSSTRFSPDNTAESFPVTDSIPSPKAGPEILTLVAAQERRVLELREELGKAETELNALKKQWALYEANKKREEVRQVRKVPVALDEVQSPKPLNDDEMEEERRRRRRRTLVEMNNNAAAHQTSASVGGKLGRKSSKRVFEGRHTRTLSLLSPTSDRHGQTTPGISMDELLENGGEAKSSEEAQMAQSPKPNLSRIPMLDGFMSPDSLQESFGKTYKDLAAHRRSLPPVSADMFMKSGKQVVDGVREGLWTFFEDIRQATVGDEAINGPATLHRPRRQSRGLTKRARRKSKSGRSPAQESNSLKDASFWTEFGLDTPGKVSSSPPQDVRNGHVQQKRSTDAQNPPGLLADTNEHDEDWENWESPVSTKIDVKGTDSLTHPGESLPWPELKKMTPSKLSRTVSDLMREWHDESDQQTSHAQNAAAAHEE